MPDELMARPPPGGGKDAVNDFALLWRHELFDSKAAEAVSVLLFQVDGDRRAVRAGADKDWLCGNLGRRLCRFGRPGFQRQRWALFHWSILSGSGATLRH